MFFWNKKRGDILVENVVFIILNLIFLGIIILFLVNQGSGQVVVEEIYAKQIALVIDSAKPIMTIKIDMKKAREIAEENGIKFEEIVKQKDNEVFVKLGKGDGSSYSFFNNVDVSIYPDAGSSDNYIIKINGYKNE